MFILHNSFQRDDPKGALAAIGAIEIDNQPKRQQQFEFQIIKSKIS